MASIVPSLYQSVIDDVINSVRDVFLDDGQDEQVLAELKQTWERKLFESKSMDHSDTSNSNNQRTSSPPLLPASAVVHTPEPADNVQFADPELDNRVPTPTVPAVENTSPSGPTIATLTPVQPAAPIQSSIIAPVGIPTAVLPSAAISVVPTAVPAAAVIQATSMPSSILPPVAGQPETLAITGNAGAGNHIVQLDGPNSSEEEDDDDDDYNDEDDQDDQNDDEIEQPGEEEEPLNSEDDVSDEDPIEIFDTENVVVCQYDKVTRSRNKWKFNFKDGIMNLQSKDYVFQKASGDAEW